LHFVFECLQHNKQEQKRFTGTGSPGFVFLSIDLGPAKPTMHHHDHVQKDAHRHLWRMREQPSVSTGASVSDPVSSSSS
jgi:hypothetical protein